MSFMDFGDVVYDQLLNATFSSKIESVQCNAAPAITGAIRGKILLEVRTKEFTSQALVRCLCLFYNALK